MGLSESFVKGGGDVMLLLLWTSRGYFHWPSMGSCTSPTLAPPSTLTIRGVAFGSPGPRDSSYLISGRVIVAPFICHHW